MSRQVQPRRVTRTKNIKKAIRQAAKKRQREAMQSQEQVGRLARGNLLVEAKGEYRDMSLHRELLEAKERQDKLDARRSARELYKATAPELAMRELAANGISMIPAWDNLSQAQMDEWYEAAPEANESERQKLMLKFGGKS